jgi:hypothetical protein
MQYYIIEYLHQIGQDYLLGVYLSCGASEEKFEFRKLIENRTLNEQKKLAKHDNTEVKIKEVHVYTSWLNHNCPHLSHNDGVVEVVVENFEHFSDGSVRTKKFEHKKLWCKSFNK